MVVFCDSDAPEKACPPFMLGLGALASELDVMLFFTMSGLNIIKRGGAKDIQLPNAPMTLPEFVQKARDMGARMVACSAVFPMAGVTEEDIIEGVTIGGVATFVSEAEEADIVLTF